MEQTRVEKSFCRMCGGVCAVEVTIEDGKISKIRGDKSDPQTRGFTCFKGLQAPEQHHGPRRLRTSLKRAEGGGHEPIASDQALREVAEHIRLIVDQHGPNAVALYTGTQAFMSVTGRPFARAFLPALGSDNNYATMTIDQSAKWVAEARIGAFAAGRQTFETSDVWMLIGTNPMVSLLGGPGLSGFATQDPVKTLKDAKARGLKLIVIDPRRTETAHFADLFLQPRAGEDAVLIAGILNVVLSEGWQDQDFCDSFVDGLEDLRTAIAPFTPALVAARTDVPQSDIVAAARMFAHECKTGMAGSGTGSNMGPHSNLAEHLLQVLNTICGRYLRAGDAAPNPGVIQPGRDYFEEVSPPLREWETGPKTALHGLGQLKGQMMSAALADEILSPKPDRIRALICTGGNPAAALPDQTKAMKALGALELLVTVDPQMSATAAVAHYVIAPKVQYERPDHTGAMEFLMGVPYAHYTPALISPEGGMDVVDDWYVFWRLARELGLQLRIGEIDVPMNEAPDMETVMNMVTPNPRVPLDEIRRHPGGRNFPGTAVVKPARPGKGGGRVQLLAPDVAEDLRLRREDLAQPSATDPDFPYKLAVRRERDVINSFLTDFHSVAARQAHPSIYLHPDTMAAERLNAGDLVRISSSHGTIRARAASDDRLRREVVQMTHCWPGVETGSPEDGHTGRLVDSDWKPEAINRMPIMSAIPVAIQKVVSSAGEALPET